MSGFLDFLKGAVAPKSADMGEGSLRDVGPGWPATTPSKKPVLGRNPDQCCRQQLRGMRLRTVIPLPPPRESMPMSRNPTGVPPRKSIQDFPRTIGRLPKSAGAGPKSAGVSADRWQNLGDGRPARNPEFRTPIFAARSFRNTQRRRRKGRRREIANLPPGRDADPLKSRFPDSPDFQGNRNSSRTTDIGRRAAPYPQNLGPGSVARIPGFPHPGPRFYPRPPLKRPTAISGNVAPKSCLLPEKRRRRTSENRTPRNFSAGAGPPRNSGLADASANRRRNIRPGRPSLDIGLRIPFFFEAPFRKNR